jgi:hypothetical protein
MQDVKGGLGMDLFLFFKIVKTVLLFLLKRGTLFCHWQRWYDFHRRHFNWFQNFQSKTRKRSKTLKGSLRMGGGRNMLKISALLPLIRTFQMNPLLARSISLDSTFNILFLCSQFSPKNTDRWSQETGAGGRRSDLIMWSLKVQSLVEVWVINF